MSEPISRRTFTVASASIVLGAAGETFAAENPPKPVPAKPAPGPVEAAFERDYPAPTFQPGWKKPQINRVLVQDFVIYGHSDLALVKKLLDKEPALLNAAVDWGNGDWETALGASAHMGNREIAEFLLGKGARIDIFCAAMLGLTDAVKAFLTLQPALIDARGPHGFSLHFHAQVGGAQAEKTLDYLQTVKKIEMKPNPFLKKP